MKKLTKHGNSLALVIDKPILELLDIDEDTPLTVATDGKVLIVEPAPAKSRQRKFKSALEQVNKQYGAALRRLA